MNKKGRLLQEKLYVPKIIDERIRFSKIQKSYETKWDVVVFDV